MHTAKRRGQIATIIARHRDYLLRLERRGSEGVIQSSTKEMLFLLCPFSLPLFCFSLLLVRVYKRYS
jgi:hypothetical protein